MMAFERIEPFGALHEEYMAGSICAAVTNPHLKSGAKGKVASDFMPSLRRALGIQDTPDGILMDDPDAQAKLIRDMLGAGPRRKKR